MSNTKCIPAGSYSAADILRVARAHRVRGDLVSRGRKTETRAYPVRLDSGDILHWTVTAPAAEHTK